MNGRNEDIERIIQKIARINKKPMPHVELVISPEVKEKHSNPMMLFNTKKMAVLSSIVGFVW